MKKSLAIVTSLILLFTAFSSVQAASNPAPEPIPFTLSGEKGEAGDAAKAIRSASQAVQSQEEFFYETPLPAEMGKYLVSDFQSHWAAKYLGHFIFADILKGYEVQPGQYQVKPDNNITRAEFVTILVRALNLGTNNSGKSFVDVPSGAWYADSVRIASSLGIVNGIDATHFGPNLNIKRSEIAAMVIRAFGNTLQQNGSTKVFTDLAANHWAKAYIDSAVKAQVINGYPDNTFRPENYATRAEAVKMLYSGLWGQKSNLPTDVEIAKVFVDLENGKLINNYNQDYNKTLQLVDKYTFGFQHANELYRLLQYQTILNKGFGLSFGLVGDAYEIKIVEKSNTMAMYEVTDVTQQVYKIKNGNVVQQLNEPINNLVCLRKMADGQWKIYFNMPK